MFEFVVSSPSVCNDAGLAIAASRAGVLGIVDLQFTTDDEAALAQLARVSAQGRGRWGVHVDQERLLATILASGLDGLEAIVVSSADDDRLSRLLRNANDAGLRALAVATCLDQAVAAHAAGADAVIAKGHEAGGWVGEEGSFVLLQRLIAKLPIPVWVQGGIGLHSVAAAYASGAAGAVLDSQLLLARDSQLPEEMRAAIGSMDGSETTTFGAELGAPVRVYARPGLEPLTELRELEAALERTEESQNTWRDAVKARVRDGLPHRGLLMLGQDAAFAADLAARFCTVAGIIAALRESIMRARKVLTRANPLSEDAPLAQSHGTRFPIVQGPMTRVSDRAEFAAAVSQAGALPFLALALMRAAEADTLLTRTKELTGDLPWGVGVLGFVPPELRAEQLDVVRAHRPPFALIAGGRPDQAMELERDGITTYLHVPSPGLLKLYLADGARRFVFEGRECGGHVGPRASFVLWDTMLRVLLEELPDGTSDCHVLFAGGIHDARSAAGVAAAAAAATERGIRIGVLLGTAYLFTREATETGAITPTFQEAAIASSETVLLESGPGHATRCLPSPFVAQFEAEKHRLRGQGIGSEELRTELEQLNVGRLRIAAKGADRHPRFGTDPDAPKLRDVEPAEQWDRGMYMIGQVASLRDEITTLEDLHRDISNGSTELLAATADEVVEPEPAAPEPADVAIIGVGCILPGAPDAPTFWSNILDKVDAIGEVPAGRWDWRRHYDPDRSAPDKVNSRWGGFIDPVPFDPMAMGMPPRSLGSIEPFQLLALITAQAALRDAGYGSRPFERERTSVILGAGGGGADLAVGYTVRSALPGLLGDEAPELERRLYQRLPEWTEDSFAGLLMNVASGRIANRLDFGGTNFTVDAACASSLAAIGLGARELQVGTSDMVLAGGVDAIQNPFAYLCFAKTQALSPRGRCRPFDASADGIAISEGFATVVLKRLADAERDGDRIYAVIKGVGAASDGRDRSLTAPRPEGQMRALRRAYAQARISPSTVGLIEAHGTGTVAGDSAEIEALSTVFAEHGTARQACAVGSVKSMIGHTKATAGVAGLVKAALALHHRVLPPTIGVTEPNPKADLGNSPFYVSAETRPWLTGGTGEPRRAGVSAFGFGGTDFHIVLEEYRDGFLDVPLTTLERWPGELLLWRGDRAWIAQAIDSLASALAAGAAPGLADLALTLAEDASGAEEDGSTLALVVESLGDLTGKLETVREMLAQGASRLHSPGGVHWSKQPLAADGGVAFLFPGQGSQTVDMARELAIAFPQAHAPFELADRLLCERLDQPLSRYVFPPPSFTDEERRRRLQELTDTRVAQPALGAAELAYLGVLRALGVEPDMAAGHSYGELVALAAADALDDGQLLRLSEARGRFMREATAGEAGAMAAIDAAPDALEPLLSEGGVVAANMNAPLQTVVSGQRARVEAAVGWCRERELGARLLPVACAFHSPHMAGARQRLIEEIERASIGRPRFPVYSNTTATAHAREPASIAKVLAEHLVKPVRFVEEIEAMYEDGARLFVEVGPRAVLTGLTGQILGDREHLAVPVDGPGRSGLLALLQCLAAVAAEGVPVRLERLLHGRGARRIDLRRMAGERGPGGASVGWLVDGGGARPAAEPERSSEPAGREPAAAEFAERKQTTPDPEEQPAVTTTSTNGAGLQLPIANPEHPSAAVEAVGVHGPPVFDGRPPPGADRVADVMTHYQQVMQQFLIAERDVMLSYLGAARPTPGSAASPSGPRTRPMISAPAAGDVEALPVVTAAAAPVPATPPTVADAAVSEPSDGDGMLTAEKIQDRLLSVVSERTGYPAEMLGLDADMEGDLGIDSIKRVEIAGTFAQTLPERDRGSIDMEALTVSRTLREVLGVLESGLASGDTHSEQPADSTESINASGDSPPEPRPFEQRPAETERVGRFVVQPASAPAIDATAGLADRGTVAVFGDDTKLAEHVSAALADQRDALLLPRASAPNDETEAAELAAFLRAEHRGVSALIHIAAADDEDGALASLFMLCKALQRDLETAAAAGGAAVIGVTRMGGAFGVDGHAPDGTEGHGAVAGFLKALALEWPTVRVKAVDLPSGADSDAARHVVAELHAADGLVEVGYRGSERTQLTLVPAPLSDRDDDQPVSPDSVLMLTGGARGITARIALALAERHRPTLVLVGRTPPADESPETASLTDVAALRAKLIESRRRAGDELTPALVERDCRRILRGREVRENLDRLRVAGAKTEYRQCDVQDADAFASLIDDVYERHGRIDGVIHGAGLIEDRLVADKQLESLQRVIATKAGSARTLARKLRPETLRFLALFSSVSGRFGNRGQADYAAASETLCKLAHKLDRRWAARVVSIDWGPWRGAGMAATLEHEFARRGVALIAPAVGCRMLEQELALGRKGEAEVVIGAASGLSNPGAPRDRGDLALLAAASDIEPQPGGGIKLVRSFALRHDRYLDHHRVDGRAVLPFAAAMELMAETAAIAPGEREPAGLREIRLLSGVAVPDEGQTTVQVSATPRSAETEVEVVIGAPDRPRPHYRSIAMLRPVVRADTAPVVDPPAPLPELAPFPLRIEDAYRDLLFHGPVFQGIVAIDGMDERGSTAMLRGSSPSSCLADADGLRWLLDPVLIDSALQVQVLWARLQWDVTLLPAEISSYTREGTRRDGELVRHEFRIRPSSTQPMCHADHWFYGDDGRLIATLGDVVGVGTQALNRLAAARA